MNQNLNISLSLSDTKMLWVLLTNERHRVEEKLNRAPTKLPYWEETLSEISDLLKQFDQHFKINEDEKESD